MIGEVYFIVAPAPVNRVKIGWSQASKYRLRALAAWSPVILELAATVEGPMDLEYRFHAKFSGAWLHKEWFDLTPDLAATIAAIQAGSFDIRTLSPAKRRPYKPRKRQLPLRRAA